MVSQHFCTVHSNLQVDFLVYLFNGSQAHQEYEVCLPELHLKSNKNMWNEWMTNELMTWIKTTETKQEKSF